MALDFTALDFETVAPDGAAICSVGLAKVRNGIVTDSESWMVNPPIEESSWNPMNMHVNGLSPQDIRNADQWPEVFNRIKKFVGGDIIAAHNAKRADLNYLWKECAYYGIDYGEIRYVCTMEMGKHFHPEFTGYALGKMCRKLDVEFSEKTHHEAAYDAVKCAELLVAMVRDENADDIESLEFNHNMKEIMNDGAIQNYVKTAIKASPHGSVDDWFRTISPEPAEPGDSCAVCGRPLTTRARKNARKLHCCTAKCIKKLTESLEMANHRINNTGNFVHTDVCRCRAETPCWRRYSIIIPPAFDVLHHFPDLPHRTAVIGMFHPSPDGTLTASRKDRHLSSCLAPSMRGQTRRARRLLADHRPIGGLHRFETGWIEGAITQFPAVIPCVSQGPGAVVVVFSLRHLPLLFFGEDWAQCK